MMTPRSVRNARILCRTSAEEETRKSSAVFTRVFLRLGRLRSRRPFLLLVFLLDDHPVAFLALAQTLEGSGYDLLSDRRSLLDLDHQLAREPGLDLLELELPVLDE